MLMRFLQEDMPKQGKLLVSSYTRESCVHFALVLIFACFRVRYRLQDKMQGAQVFSF